MINILVTDNRRMLNSLDALAPQLDATAPVREKGGGGGQKSSIFVCQLGTTVRPKRDQ
jgi:hypothetical protein